MKHTAGTLGHFIAIAAIILSIPGTAVADIYVIANSAMKITADDILSIYTGDKELAATIKIKPVDNRAAQGEFLGKVLKLNSNRYDSLWTMKSFRDGLTPPPAKSTDAEVISYVQSTPGAIGYVSTEPPSGVSVLKKY